jgi:L-ascorbate metabolism protein UlaG (beta-lactamase superfamily)
MAKARIRWYGQSTFLLSGERSVFIDPFGVMDGLAERGLRFDYPPIGDVEADLLLVTHEHADHNVVEVVGGSPEIVRSTAGTFETPVGEVIAVASEHDDVAGTLRGPNTIFRFTLDGLGIAHLGDFGQAGLRPEQQAAIVRALRPRLVVPMHYRTEAVNFLEPPDEFLAALGARIERVYDSELEAEQFLGTADDPTVALLQPPTR